MCSHLFRRSRRSAALFLTGLGLASRLQAAEFQGWITDAISGAPVEGAGVTLDLEPPNGVPEYTNHTTAMGFVKLPGVATGTYRLSIDRPGYSVFQTTVAFSGAQPVHGAYQLTPLPGGPGFDIYAQVGDVTSGLQLKDIPLGVLLFNNPADSLPATIWRANTDTNGFALFRGLPNGFYRFRANSPADGVARAGWLAYTNPDATNLASPYLASILLKPAPQMLTVQVTGFDPVRQLVGPLTNFVTELTGLDPRDTNRVVLPVRSGLTDTNGLVTFTGLPPVVCRLKTKRLGYLSAEVLVPPDAGGLLPASTNLTPVFQTNSLHVTFTSPYNPSQFLLFYNVPLVVQGLKNTGTEGVQRVVNVTSLFDPPHIRSTTNLPPGRYHVFVAGPATTNTFYPVHPQFTGDDYVEVLPGTNTDATLGLDVLRATVHGRLLAADTMGGVEASLEYGQHKPIYQERQQSGIEIVEYAADRLLPTNANVITVEADAKGEFIAHLLPARYGLRIPGMTNYWGSHVRVLDLTTNSARVQGWPFPTNWPFAGQPPANGTPNPGTPLTLASNVNWSVDVFVRRQVAALYAWLPELPSPELFNLYLSGDFLAINSYLALALDPAGPISAYSPTSYYQDLLMDDPTAMLTPLVGPPRVLPLLQPPQSGVNGLSSMEVVFEGVAPGTYSFSVSAARHSISNAIGGSIFQGDAQFEPLPVAITLPPWKPPGIVPDVNPAAADFVAPLTYWYPVSLYAFYPLANTTLRIENYYWDPNQTNYVLSGTASATNVVDSTFPLEFWSPSYAGGRLFYAPAGLPGVGHFLQMQMPAGAFTFYSLQAFPERWFRGDVPGPGSYTFQIYDGGPNDNLNAAAPTRSYSLTLKSVSDDDPTFDVPGTTMTLITLTNISGTNLFVTNAVFAMNNQTIANYKGAYSGLVQNPNWEYLRSDYSVPSSLPPQIVNVARMRRGTAVNGMVTNRLTGAALSSVRVQLLTRFGQLLQEITNNVDGSFAFPSALANAATVFADVRAPGFFPWRQRFTPADAVPDPLSGTNSAGFLNLAFVIRVGLDPLPPPSIPGVALDRFGLFLPGVKKAGLADATEALTLTWTARVKTEPVNFLLPAFDDPVGNATAASMLSFTDQLAEVWFVDPRSFATNIYSDPPVALSLPNTNNIPAVLDWLGRIDRGTLPHVFHQVITGFQPTDETNVVAATGQIPLWKLPPDFLDPVIVAVSQGGAVAIRSSGIYTNLNQELQGARLPPWMVSATDLLGISAGLQATAEQLQSYVPEGRFLPLPKFTASIDAATNGLLSYRYTMDVQWNEGEDTPDSGLLSLGSSVLGFDFTSRVEFGLSNGAQQSVYLDIGAGASKEDVDLKELLPKWAERFSPTASFSVDAHSLAVRNFGLTDQYEFELTHQVHGDVDLSVGVDLTPVAGRLPYVGPVISLLHEAGALTISAGLTNGVAMDSVVTWRTLFPPVQDFTSPDPDPHVLRRHFLGGTEGLVQKTNNLLLCYRLGAGLAVSALGDHLGASGFVALAGNECALPPKLQGKPSVNIVPNEFGDWPVIKRVTGQVDAGLEAHLNLWIADIGKSWNWNLLTFDHQFGTDPAFQLIPVLITNKMALPTNAPPVNFHTNGTTLIDNLFPAGSLSASGAGGCAVLFTDTDPATGNTLLKVTLFTPANTWTAPVTLASAGGIINSAIRQLPSGQWLAVWTELSAADLLNPYPPSTVRFSMSDAVGNTWSAGATVAALTDVADRLRLMAGPALVGLAFTHTPDGPLAETWSLATTTWNGTQWSAPSAIVTNVPVASFDAVANVSTNVPEAMIAFEDGTGLAQSFARIGQTNSGPNTISTNGGRKLSLAAAPGNGFYLIQGTTEGNIEFLASSGTNGWLSLSVIATNVLPSEVQLTTMAGPSPRFLITWVEGAAVTVVRYALADPQGTLLLGPLNLTTNTVGRYHDLHILTGCGPAPKAIVRYTTDHDAVQVFSLSLSEAPQLLNPMFGAIGGFEFDLVGVLGRFYRVQTSSNLTDWVDLTSLTLTNSPSHFQDAAATNRTARFYRAVEP